MCGLWGWRQSEPSFFSHPDVCQMAGTRKVYIWPKYDSYEAFSGDPSPRVDDLFRHFRWTFVFAPRPEKFTSQPRGDFSSRCTARPKPAEKQSPPAPTEMTVQIWPKALCKMGNPSRNVTPTSKERSLMHTVILHLTAGLFSRPERESRRSGRSHELLHINGRSHPATRIPAAAGSWFAYSARRMPTARELPEGNLNNYSDSKTNTHRDYEKKGRKSLEKRARLTFFYESRRMFEDANWEM